MNEFITEEFLLSQGFVKSEREFGQDGFGSNIILITYTKNNIVFQHYFNSETNILTPTHKCECCQRTSVLHTPEEVLHILNKNYE